MANHFVTPQIMVFQRGKIKGGRHCVVDASATDATQMIVLGRIPVETGIAAGVFEFLDQAHSSEQVKVAVYGAQADIGKSPPDEVVEFHRRRMGSNRLQLLKNNLPLPRLSAMACRMPL